MTGSAHAILKIITNCQQCLAGRQRDAFLSDLNKLTSLNLKFEVLEDDQTVSQNENNNLILIASELNKVIVISIVPEFTNREHFTFEESDFKGFKDRTELTLTLLRIIFEKLKPFAVQLKTILRLILPDLLIFLSSNSEPSLWCSLKLAQQTNLIFESLQIIYECEENLNSVLFQSGVNYTPDLSVFGRYLQMIQIRLNKTNWRKNPNIQKSYQWMLKQVTFSHLGDYLDMILPPALNFVDDFEVQNKCVGITCLKHVINNVSQEKLRWYGRADVIFDILYQQLFNHDPQLIDILHPTLLSLLPVFGKIPDDIENHHKVFSTILRDVEFENKILVKRSLTTNLYQFVDLLGISVIKHSKKLLLVVEAYLEMFDGPEEITRINILKLLEHFLYVAWPRAPQYTLFLSKTVFKFILDMSTDETTTPQLVKATLITEAEKCLMLIKICDEQTIISFIKSVKSLELNTVVKTVISNIEKQTSADLLPNNMETINLMLNSLNINKDK